MAERLHNERVAPTVPLALSSRTRRRRLRGSPWLLAVPAVGLLIAFSFAPFAFGSYYAFTNWNGLSPARWIGLANFREIFRDPTARGALWHTLELTICFVVAANVLGLLLALGLDRTIKTRNFLRLVFFAPVVLSSLATAYIWQWIFTPTGALNRILGDVGLHSLERPWLGDPSTAIWTILVVMIWQSTGLALVIYLAGLQSIPDDVYEAALVDGASDGFRFRKVVLPLLAPAVTISVTLSVIHGLHVFDAVYALTGGGPYGATETLATQIYGVTFVQGRFGYGAAYALLLTILVSVVAVTQLAVFRRNESRL
jgi:raffinose/stachyose/melibiose transport system permease protein